MRTDFAFWIDVIIVLVECMIHLNLLCVDVFDTFAISNFEKMWFSLLGSRLGLELLLVNNVWLVGVALCLFVDTFSSPPFQVEEAGCHEYFDLFNVYNQKL